MDVTVCCNCVGLYQQASLNNSMESLKAELNTALQCDREAEEEVRKLKVRNQNKSIPRNFCKPSRPTQRCESTGPC